MNRARPMAARLIKILFPDSVVDILTNEIPIPALVRWM